MPNFSVRPTSGVTSKPWGDPASGERASRINPSTVAPHRHWVVVAGTEVVVAAKVDGGSEAALDGTLGGNLFNAWLAERPEFSSLVVVESPPGQSSVQKFTPYFPGHYTLMMRRKGGGGVIVHFDVEAPTE